MPEPQETSRAKHTEGPWTYVPRHVAESEPEVRAPAGWLIACTASDYDARLIASAPELLAALRDLFNNYKQLADSGDAGFWRIEDTPEGQKAMAAIAKATGA